MEHLFVKFRPDSIADTTVDYLPSLLAIPGIWPGSDATHPFGTGI